jgi:O-antigen/teichoic acid export membrane protein
LNLLKQSINHIKTSELLQSITTLASGTTLAQAISVFTAPILFRIYDSEDYGTMGLYMAIVSVIGVFSTMQYNNAILLEREDEDAKVAMWFNRLINTAVALITLLIVFLFGETVANTLGNARVAPWLYLAPISIFFNGQGQIFSVWANRKKKYRILAFNAILTALLVPVVSVSIGLLNNGPFGLFMGLLASHVLPSIVLLFMLTKNENLGRGYLKMDKIRGFAKKYQRFPMYSLPAEFVSNFSHNLPVLMLSKYFGSEIVAFFTLSNRVLGVPTNLISNAVASVYKQKIIKLYNETGNVKYFYLKTLKTLLLSSIFFFGFGALLIPVLFPILFGNEWNAAIPVSQLMIIVFAMRFVNTPLSYIINIRDKQHIDLIASLYFVVTTIIIFSLVSHFDLDYMHAIWLYVLNFCSIYLIMMLYNHKLSIKL